MSKDTLSNKQKRPVMGTNALDLGEHGAIYLSYNEYDEDKDSPILVIQGDHGLTGYFVDPCTAELTRICICHAKNESECLCGGWEYEY